MDILSNNNIKLINSLQLKKQREKNGLYIIEGDKMVSEYIKAGEEVTWLFAKPEWISSLPAERLSSIPNIIKVSYDDLKKISSLKTPHNALALVALKRDTLPPCSSLNDLVLLLDNIQDPGNLGTIIRLAGWFGVGNIFCSPGCVDVYNPKVMQATMGAMLHVKVWYTELPEILSEMRSENMPVFATTLSGSSVYKMDLPSSAAILFGNESKGISPSLLPFVTDEIMIPAFGKRGAGIDSLNVSISAAVICSEFRRTSAPGQ